MAHRLSHSPASHENTSGPQSVGRSVSAEEHDDFRLSAVVNASDDAILSKTLDGVITSWNPAAERMFGYTAAEIIGKPKTILFPADRLYEEEAILDRLRSGIPTDHFETVQVRKDGTSFDVSITVTRIKDRDGRVVGASTVARDITRRKEEEEQVRLISTGAAESKSGIVITDAQGSMVYVNPAFERISGYALAEVQGRHPGDLLQGPETDAGTCGQVRDAIAAEEPVAVEILNYHKDGTPYWVEMHLAPVRDKTGVAAHYIAVENDVTIRKHAEAEAEASHREQTMLLESSPDCMTLLDAQGCLLHMNERGKCLLEVEDFSLLQGVDWLQFWKGGAKCLARDAMQEAIEGRVGRFEGFCPTAKGTPMWWDVIVSPLLDDAGQVIQLLAVSRDITAHHQLNERQHERMAQIEAQNVALEDLATRDGLTGLMNHRALQQRLREEHERALRYGTSLSVLMLDVDKFKSYNDVFGHLAGDAILRQVAQILRETARGCDVVARYGGEEFVVLLPGASTEEPNNIGERFRHAIETATWQDRAITVSVGVAALTPATVHPDALLADADAAMYHSKRRGGNSVTHAT